MGELEKIAAKWEKHRILVLSRPYPGAELTKLQKLYLRLKTRLLNLIPASYYLTKMKQTRRCDCQYTL